VRQNRFDALVAMPWWLDAVLLVSAALLWFSGSADRDDVWGLLLKMLAGIAVLVVLLGGRQILLEGLALALALWLPSASSRRLLSNAALRSEVGPR
jgi:hypothetical protein